VALGQWVLTEAVEQASRWQAKGLIWWSPSTSRRCGFVPPSSTAWRQPGQAGLEPYRLELELTESILIHDINETLVRLQALARLGVSLSIDDFGTGYSSLTYLKRFPVQKLKIDRSFVKACLTMKATWRLPAPLSTWVWLYTSGDRRRRRPKDKKPACKIWVATSIRVISMQQRSTLTFWKPGWPNQTRISRVICLGRPCERHE
jgi:hypothetical protein